MIVFQRTLSGLMHRDSFGFSAHSRGSEVRTTDGSVAPLVTCGVQSHLSDTARVLAGNWK